jgi:hypothetical protein
MSNLLDTILNVSSFAFIALLVWLYLKPDQEGDKTPEDEKPEPGG